MNGHILDRPIWTSLTSRHAAFAEGDAHALRFQRDVSPFAAARDDSPESLAALARLLPEKGVAVQVQAGPIPTPPGSAVTLADPAVQMLAERPAPVEAPPYPLQPLGDADAEEMRALALLTEPGPFERRTHRLGAFLGVRLDGRLAAMAGERLKQPGLTEVSGVCTHPDFRGRGLARALSAAVAARIAARGETPYLHAYATNDAAVRLYESLGFTVRREMSVATVRRA